MALQPEQIIEKIAPIFTQGIIVIIGIAFVMIVFKLILKSIFKPKEKSYESEPRYREESSDQLSGKCEEMGAIKVLLLIILVQTSYITYSLFQLGIGD